MTIAQGDKIPATTFKKMKEVQADSRVESCWSVKVSSVTDLLVRTQ